jgi:DNA-binding MarR family transcriptional regulator
MFQMKRAHLRALANARPLSVRNGMTPARYDFMRAVAWDRSGERHQSMLWRTLGLSRMSVSKMVRRLIELGLVQRRRSPTDGRTFLVSLTEEGYARFRSTIAEIYRENPFQDCFERAFGERSAVTNQAVDKMNTALERVARHLGDTSWQLYFAKAPVAEDELRPSRRVPGARRRSG